MRKIQAVILAAGQSKRFNTGRSKLTEQICGQEMILYTTTLLDSLNIPATAVLGFQAEQVQAIIEKQHGHDFEWVQQQHQRGRGHALLCTRHLWDAEHILVMNGDTPFVSEEVIASLRARHEKRGAIMSVVKSHSSEPCSASYDHIVHHDDGKIEIVSAQEFNTKIHESCCVDAGIYLINREFLTDCTEDMGLDSKGASFHFGDLVREAYKRGQPVEMVSAPFDQIRSVDTFRGLWCAQQVKRAELMRYWMSQGVHFFTAQNVHLDLNVKIGVGSFIGCGVQLFGNTVIGQDARIEHFSVIEDSTIGDGSIVAPHSVLQNATLAPHAQVGPFAHLQDTTSEEKYMPAKRKQRAPNARHKEVSL